MTIAELLSLLGLSWSRLFIFPGGLFAFAVVALAECALARRRAVPLREDQNGGICFVAEYQRCLAAVSGFFRSDARLPALLTGSAIVPPWLGIALLPLPFAAPPVRPIDIVATVALLEWPRLLAIAADLRDGDQAHVTSGTRRLAAALNGYPPLVLSVMLLAQATGTLESAGFLRLPAHNAAITDAAWFWIGVAALALALPPLLDAGPFASGTSDEGIIGTGLRLRTLGLILLAVIPWLALLTRMDQLWAAWLPPVVLAGLLWLFHRATQGASAIYWARIYLAYDAVLLLLLLLAAILDLRQRLV